MGGRDDTSIGAGQSAFPATQWGRLQEAGERDPEAARALLSDLTAAYWRPVYKFVRIAWRKGNEDAKDLTQEFLSKVMQPEFLSRADARRGTFRTYLLASLKNFLKDHGRYEGAAKRGGGQAEVRIDWEEVDGVPAADADPEREFARAWAESLLADALKELEKGFAERGRAKIFGVFKEHSIDTAPGHSPSYQEVADRLGMSVSEVTNALHEARQELRRLLSQRVRRYVATEEEVEPELRSLFGR